MKTKREEAMNWWINLPDHKLKSKPDTDLSAKLNKTSLCEKFHGTERTYKSLTGFEIQKIWEHVTGEDE